MSAKVSETAYNRPPNSRSARFHNKYFFKSLPLSSQDVFLGLKAPLLKSERCHNFFKTEAQGRA